MRRRRYPLPPSCDLSKTHFRPLLRRYFSMPSKYVSSSDPTQPCPPDALHPSHSENSSIPNLYLEKSVSISNAISSCEVCAGVLEVKRLTLTFSVVVVELAVMPLVMSLVLCVLTWVSMGQMSGEEPRRKRKK
jgi:hypothetical protein